MQEVPRLLDGLMATLPAAVLMVPAVVFMQLAENLAQLGRATGFVQLALKDLRRTDHDVGQV